MRRFRKSTWLPSLFGIIGVVFYVYNGVSHHAWKDNLTNMLIYVLIIVALAWALRKKERYEDERNNRQ